MSITITGLDQLYKKLGSAAATHILEPPMQRSVLRVQRTLQDYPALPPQSKYIRSGTLGRRWTKRVQRSGNGLIGRVGTTVPYAPYVQSRRFQTALHRRTGWMTDIGAVQQNEGVIVADFQGAVRRALGG